MTNRFFCPRHQIALGVHTYSTTALQSLLPSENLFPPERFREEESLSCFSHLLFFLSALCASGFHFFFFSVSVVVSDLFLCVKSFSFRLLPPIETESVTMKLRP